MNRILSKIANKVRNFIIFRIRYPWIRYGKDIHCKLNVSFWSPNRHIFLGDHVFINSGCIFYCDTEIGNKVLIAQRVTFLNSKEHRFDIVGKMMWDTGRGSEEKIIIDDDVWIGAGAIILSPVYIGRGSVIAAGSVVKSDIPPYAIVAGVPSKVIRMRFSQKEIEEHEKLLVESGELPEQKKISSD